MYTERERRYIAMIGNTASLNLDLNLDPHERSVHQTAETALIEELNQMSKENKKLSEMLIFMCKKHANLQSHLTGLEQNESENLECKSKKRKWEGDNSGVTFETNGNHESSSLLSHEGLCKRPKQVTTHVSTVHVRIHPSDNSLIVKDGYQWRKYGQKVTRDNPSPRAYYKCSFAPSCPVKKKVQKSIEDPCVLVAIYEGEHNHQRPCQAEGVCLGFGQGLIPEPNIPSSHDSNTTKKAMPAAEEDATALFPPSLVDQIANSLSRNPSFTSALAAAISSRALEQDLADDWETLSTS